MDEGASTHGRRRARLGRGLAATLALLLAACSPTAEPDTTTEPPPETTAPETTPAETTAPDSDAALDVAEASDALAGAAAALLEAPAVEATALRFDEEGTLIRSDWTDLRPSGDRRELVAVWGTASADQSEPGLLLTGIVQVDGTVYTAFDQPDRTEPWTENPDAAPTPPDQLPSLNLASLTEGLELDGEEEVVAVERSDTDDGVRWRVELERSGGEARFERVWTIRDGLLATYQVTGVGSSVGLLPAARLRWELAPVDDPSPITAPEVGTSLDPGVLGVPETVPMPGPGR